jgi:hypothetical protein
MKHMLDVAVTCLLDHVIGILALPEVCQFEESPSPSRESLQERPCLSSETYLATADMQRRQSMRHSWKLCSNAPLSLACSTSILPPPAPWLAQRT